MAFLPMHTSSPRCRFRLEHESRPPQTEMPSVIRPADPPSQPCSGNVETPRSGQPWPAGCFHEALSNASRAAIGQDSE